MVAKGGDPQGKCTTGANPMYPGEEKDEKDCIVNGGIWGAAGSTGGPEAGAAGAAAGCASSVYGNHSK